MADRLTLTKPDDWHLHLRDGAILEGILAYSASDFARAIIMPNLVPPVVTSKDAIAYRQRILAALPAGNSFEPLMTLYITENTDPADVIHAHREGIAKAVKLYPAGATTNSESGVREIENVFGVLEKMEEAGMPLCIHGEVNDPVVDIFDREAVFIERVLDPLRNRFPNLRVIMEHVTTKDGVDYVATADENLAATLTVHHLIINRNAVLAGGIRPHYYCLPVAKREVHRLALRKAAISGDPHFFLGTDSAPHTDDLKEAACGCAGCFTAANAIGILAHVFEEEDALDRLEGFTSIHGAAFYGLSRNQEKITLVRQHEAIDMPEKIKTGAGSITVFDPMFALHWRVEA